MGNRFNRKLQISVEVCWLGKLQKAFHLHNSEASTQQEGIDGAASKVSTERLRKVSTERLPNNVDNAAPHAEIRTSRSPRRMANPRICVADLQGG
eukprot:365582-Chlamydomonas_euryale.AAC.4